MEEESSRWTGKGRGDEEGERPPEPMEGDETKWATVRKGEKCRVT